MAQPRFPEIEQEILKYWEEHRVFEKSLAKPAPKGDFVFYDGPPFATGLPHYGHILASTIKDVIPRYKTMRGYQVRRRWGWDCHGLPIENIVEEQLGISGKKQIEERGIARFNQACREGVLKYAAEWGKMVRRIGRFVEFENSYKTMDSSYMESVWWALRQMWDKKLIYEGRKVLLYCPRCETPISNFEVAMDNSYEEVKEEAVTVKFKVKNPGKHGLPDNTYLLAWTTTPWTLPGNVALAIGANIEYVYWSDKKENSPTETYVMAAQRFNAYKIPAIVIPVSAKQLVDVEYEPLFNIPALRSRRTFKVYPADFVNTEEGTGIVHTAVVYGEEDYELGLKHKLPVAPLLDEKGVFNEKAPEIVRGKFFKDSEAVVKDDLERRGLLFKREMSAHSYPFCWRCNATLFYNAIPAWFIKIAKIKKKLLKLNEKISWYPEHLKHGRFQKGIEGAPDWNISRNRYWATPLPFWRCGGGSGQATAAGATRGLATRSRGGCGNVVCIGSLKELQERAVNYDEVYKSRDLSAIDLHRPYVDGIILKCEKCGGEMRRIPEVVDCWVESASMPFAEFHYPFENEEEFKRRYPADFVAEYIAQTRAWFYVMHVIGSTIFGKPPFRNVVTTGTILNEKGEKLSKSKRNYPEPQEVIDKYGVDALRFYLMTSPVMQADNLFFSEREVDTIYKKVVLLTLNVVSFYKLYAPELPNSPESYESFGKIREHSSFGSKHILDRWIVARLHETIRDMTSAMDGYDVVRAGRLIPQFVDDLSTWYLRRSRERFKSAKKSERDQALHTTHYILHTFSQLLAPFMPFLAEHIWQSIRHSERSEESRDSRDGRDPSALPQDDGGVDSVHLTDWPKFQKRRIDTALLEQMKLARKVVELAHALRAEAKIRVRQPLGELRIMNHESWGEGRKELLKLIAEEVNVKEVTILDRHPERSVAEPKDPALKSTGSLTTFGMTDNGWITKTDGALTIFLATEITPELLREGLARELTRLINDARKKAGLTPSDIVQVALATEDPTIREAVKEFQKPLKKAVIAKSVKLTSKPQEAERPEGAQPRAKPLSGFGAWVEVEGHGRVWIGINRV